MTTKNFIFFKNAVVITTAFFLTSASHLKVKYTHGKVEAADLDFNGPESVSLLEVNTSIESNFLIATGKGSRTEISSPEDHTTWRLGSLSVSKWPSLNECWIHSGSLLCSTKTEEPIKISSTKSKASFHGPGTFIIEATTNGGFKFIPLESSGLLATTNGGTKEVKGGRMLLIIGDPSNFGDAYDIDLMLMLKTSRLLNSFPTQLDRHKQIGVSVYVQQMNIRGKYDALIGDATSEENLQLWKFTTDKGKASISNN